MLIYLYIVSIFTLNGSRFPLAILPLDFRCDCICEWDLIVQRSLNCILHSDHIKSPKCDDLQLLRYTSITKTWLYVGSIVLRSSLDDNGQILQPYLVSIVRRSVVDSWSSGRHPITSAIGKVIGCLGRDSQSEWLSLPGCLRPSFRLPVCLSDLVKTMGNLF